MEIIDGNWRLEKSEQYELRTLEGKKEGDIYTLQNEDILSISLNEGTNLTLFYEKEASSFSVFEKYDLAYVSRIAIGKNITNDIVFDNKGLISREHAVIKRTTDKWVLEDLSKNGIFINNQRVVNSQSLKYGDLISIFGLSITFLKDFIAVNTNIADTQIRDLKKYQFQTETINDLSNNHNSISDNQTFHRSPRKIFKFENETIEIE